MYSSSKVIRKSMTTRGLLPLLISLVFAQSFYGQEANVSTRANPLDSAELSRDEKQMVWKQSLLRWKKKNPTLPDKDFNYVKPKVFSEWTDASKSLEKAQENFKRASSSEHLPTNVIKRLGPKKTLKQLETLTADIERTNMSIKNQQNKLTASDESLAREYTVRKSSEIKNKLIAVGNLEKKFLILPKSSPARIKASSAARAAKRELSKLAPGERFDGRGGDRVLKDPLKSQYNEAGMKERAKLQREHLGTKINNAKKVLDDKSPELKTVEQQITAIKNQNAAQQTLDKATRSYLAANQKLLVIKTAAQVAIAKEKLAERQTTKDQKRGLLHGPQGSGAKVQNGMAAYDELRIMTTVFKDVFELLAKIFSEQDENNALERGIKAIEEIEKMFPPLKKVKKHSDGSRYLPNTAPNKKLIQLAEDFNTMVLHRKELDKAWENIMTAKKNLETAENKYSLARRKEILRELKAMPRNAEALKLGARRRELMIEFRKLQR